MKRYATTRRTVTVSVAALALVGSLGACQAGKNAYTSHNYAPTDGRNANLPSDASAGDPYMAIRTATVVDYGKQKSLSVTIVNRTASLDVLSSATIGGKPATLSSGPVEIPPGGSVSIGPGASSTATVTGVDVKAGQWTDVSLTFGTSGTADMKLLVEQPK